MPKAPITPVLCRGQGRDDGVGFVSCQPNSRFSGRPYFEGRRWKVNTAGHSTFSVAFVHTYTCIYRPHILTCTHTSTHKYPHTNTLPFKMANVPGDKMLIGPAWGSIPTTKTSTPSAGCHLTSRPWFLNYPEQKPG